MMMVGYINLCIDLLFIVIALILFADQCRNITSCINGTVVVPRGSTCSVCAVWQVGPFGMVGGLKSFHNQLHICTAILIVYA